MTKHGRPAVILPLIRSPAGHWTQANKTAEMKRRSVRTILAAGLFLALAPRLAIARECLSHPPPLLFKSDTVQWSIIIAHGAECVQGFRRKTMTFDTASIAEQPKTGLVTIQGSAFHYYAGAEPGTDTFRLLIAGTSMRKYGTSTLRVEVQVR